jgi:hypothetical protein
MAMRKKSMKKAMKGMKRRSMKAKKSMKKRSMRKKRVSVIGKRVSVFHGTKHHTSGGLTKNDFKKNRTGRIVSKKKSDAAKRRFSKTIGKWAVATKNARRQLGIRGFQAVGGRSTRGQALLKKVRSLVK